MSEHKSFLENLAKETKPESFGQEVFVPVNGSKRLIKNLIIAAVIIVIAAAGYLFYQSTQNVKVATLAGMSINDAYLWAQKNGVTLASKNVFSMQVDQGIIVDQEIPASQTVKKGSTIGISLSQGANPEEKIAFPDVMSKKKDALDTWVKANKLSGVTISSSNSDIITKDSVISYTFTDGDETSFLRKNRVTIVISDGPAAATTTVAVVDFSAMNAGKVSQWGSDNGVAIVLQDEYNKYFNKGAVILQSIKAGTEVLKGSSITVTISKGEAFTVPNFSNMTADETASWSRQSGAVLTTIPKYSDSYSLGTYFGQSLRAGSSIAAGDAIKVYQSLGQVAITSFVGKTRLDVLSWQQTANSKGASINVVFKDDYGDAGSAGKVLAQSAANEFLPLNGTVNVTISKGMQLVIPNLVGMTKADSQLAAKNLGLTLYVEYEDNAAPAGTVVSQSIAPSTVSTDAVPITVVLSKGP